jgi:RimJ/RimL family protein N-acetyltransferase
VSSPTLEILKLDGGQARLISRILTTARPEYVQWFHPFPFDESSVRRVLDDAMRDRYFGLFADGDLAGFFMLRGLDQGYERPAFGVFIAEAYANLRLSKLAMEYSLAWCRLSGIRAVMLKVHPENGYARHVYERAGFKPIGSCPETGHRMFELRWESP